MVVRRAPAHDRDARLDARRLPGRRAAPADARRAPGQPGRGRAGRPRRARARRPSGPAPCTLARPARRHRPAGGPGRARAAATQRPLERFDLDLRAQPEAGRGGPPPPSPNPASVSRTKASSASPGHAHAGRRACRRGRARGHRPPLRAQGGHVLAALALEVVAGVGSRAPHSTSRARPCGAGPVAQGSVVRLEQDRAGLTGADASRVPPAARPAAIAGPRPTAASSAAALFAHSSSSLAGIAVGHDARPGLDAGPAVGGHHHGADGDGGVEVAREVEVADHAAVDARAWSARARR